jgi:hypothetical protein
MSEHSASKAPESRRPRRSHGNGLVRLIVSVAGATSAMLGIAGCSSSGGVAPPPPQQAHVVVGTDGKEIDYKISGNVQSARGCAAASTASTAVGTAESATTSISFKDGKLHAALGAITDIFDPYARYTGELRSDGTFTLVSDYAAPATAGASELDGRFMDDGSVTGTWSFGIADDPSCSVVIGPLSSWFYFGITHLDWRTALGVTTA